MPEPKGVPLKNGLTRKCPQHPFKQAIETDYKPAVGIDPWQREFSCSAGSKLHAFYEIIPPRVKTSDEHLADFVKQKLKDGAGGKI